MHGQRAIMTKFLTLQSWNTWRNNTQWKWLFPLLPLKKLLKYQLHQMKKNNKQMMVTQASLMNLEMHGVAMATALKKVMKLKCNQISILVHKWLRFYILQSFLSLLFKCSTTSQLLHYLICFLIPLSLKKKSVSIFPISPHLIQSCR